MSRSNPHQARADLSVERPIKFELAIRPKRIANGWNPIAQEPVFRQYRAQQNKAPEQAARSLASKSFIHAETQLPKASYYQAVIGGSVLLDKARLLAGEPTEIHATLDVPELARVKALAASLAKYVVEQSQAIEVTPTDK